MRKACTVAARSHAALPPRSALANPLASPLANPRRRRQAVFWCGLGVLSSAVFWHSAGFWSVVSEVILERALSTNVAAASIIPKQRTVDGPPIVVVDTNRCTMLTLDRRTNNTKAQTCPATSLALRFEPTTGVREDMAAVATSRFQAFGNRAD